jgi:hypothetical protein
MVSAVLTGSPAFAGDDDALAPQSGRMFAFCTIVR